VGRPRSWRHRESLTHRRDPGDRWRPQRTRPRPSRCRRGPVAFVRGRSCPYSRHLAHAGCRQGQEAKRDHDSPGQPVSTLAPKHADPPWPPCTLAARPHGTYAAVTPEQSTGVMRAFSESRAKCPSLGPRPWTSPQESRQKWRTRTTSTGFRLRGSRLAAVQTAEKPAQPYLICIPEIARAITSCWISAVPSKMS
jgi:hypothetical protein